MKISLVFAFVLSGLCLAEDLPPVRIQLILSSDFRATLDQKKIQAGQDVLRHLPPGAEAISPISPFRKPKVQAIPDRKFPQQMYVIGMSRETCRLLNKAFGNNWFTLDSVTRGDLNTVGVITLRRNDPIPQGVRSMEFKEAGRRYLLIWNRERLAEDLEVTPEHVDEAMPLLAQNLVYNLRTVVADAGTLPSDHQD